MAKVGFNKNFKEVNESRKRYIVMKGSAGSGKSQNVSQSLAIKLSDMKYKGANLLCVRKIDDSNRESTFAQLKKAIYTIFGDRWEEVWEIKNSPISLRCKTTGNTVIFRGMKDEGQRERVKSITNDNGNITWIWVEEATELTEEDVDILDDRLRGKLDNPNLYYQMILTFNPVSATHWIKSKFFDEPDENTLLHSSTYLQNRFIDEQYHIRMEKRKKRDPEGYRVYALGEWGMLGGQFFNNFKESVHVIKPFKIPKNWTRFRCMDWGSYHPYACYWVAVDFDGTLYVYRELYGYGGKANVGTKESSRTVANKIAAMETDRNLIGYGILDNACWNRQDTAAPSIAEEINKIMVENNCRVFGPSVKSREQVGEEIRLRLEGFTDNEGKQKAGLYIFNTCFHLIRTLPTITHDKNQPEKYDTNGEDHCFVAGTKITTKRGDIPIEDVTTDDYVLTRQGYKRVVASALTRKNATVYRMVASNGQCLIGTGNHPVYIKGKGFVPLDTIGYDDVLYCRGDEQCLDHKRKQQKALSLTVSNLEDTQILVAGQTENITEQTEGMQSREYVTCTDMSGSIITDQFQRGITYTTRMATQVIMLLKTLKCYPVGTTCQSIAKNTSSMLNIWQGLKKIWTNKGQKQQNGTEAMMGDRGTENTEPELRKRPFRHLKQEEYAKCVEKNTLSQIFRLLGVGQCSVPRLARQDIEGCQELMTLSKPAQCVEENTKQTNTEEPKLVENSVVLSCRREPRTADVYNLTVDEVHEYFANGFLVHNCVDAIGYGCMSRPYKPEKPKKPDPYEYDQWADKPAEPSAWGL